MELDDCRQVSAYNRYRRNEDLQIVACTCQKQSSFAIQSQLSENVIFSSLELPLFQDDKHIIDILENTIQYYLCTVFLVCYHLSRKLLTTINDWEQKIKSRLVIVHAGRTLEWLTDVQSVHLKSNKYCQEVFNKALAVMNKQGLYDDVCLENMDTTNTYINVFNGYQNDDMSDEYSSIPSETEFNSINPYTSVAQAFHSSRKTSNAIEDKTEVKEIVPSREDITNKTNQGLKRETNKDEQNPYQSLLTLKQEKLVNLANAGVEVVEEFCYPFHSYNKSEEAIVKDINTGEKATVMDMIKHVHAVTIPSAVSQINLRTLAILSDCYNNGIERRLSREIQNILFNTEVGRHDLEALLESVYLLLGVVRNRAASSDTILNTLPNVIVMLAISHHQLLSHQNKAAVSEMVMSRLQTCLVLLEEIEYPQTNETELHLINAVKRMINGLEKVMAGKKANRLQIGSWKDELPKESCRRKISHSLTKMSTFEHYSLIIRLLIELHLRLKEKNAEFLLTSLMAIKKAMKKTDGPILYPLLVVVFRGITNLLTNHIQQNHHSDEVQDNIYRTCIDMLKGCLGSAKISQECKQDLRENLNSLSFHKSKCVATAVANLTATVADKVYSYMTTILEPLSFSITESQDDQCLPRWEDLSGTIAGYKEVRVHLFRPSHGVYDLHQYHSSIAKDKKAGVYCNTLDILRSLLGGDQHPNIKRLIAFHLQTIPMFYMTEQLSDASLSTYLLRERKDRRWLPVLTLGAIALDCVRAIDYLHRRKIVHRNITASSFCYRGDHEVFVLSDFSIAKQIDDGSNGSGTFIQDIEGNLIPTRWSSPESLIDDCYDVKSDTWMLGQLVTEIFTHGCHPFPEMFTFDFDDLMDMVVFHDLKPHRWPCIPLPVHNIILQCLENKPHSRIEPKEVLQKLKNWMASPAENKDQLPRPSFDAFANRNLNYPELDPNQKEPERGPTEQLKQLKNMRGNPRVSYYNRASKRRQCFSGGECRISEQNLTAPDHPIIKEKGLYLEIEEPVTLAFLRETFPKLCNKNTLSDLLHIVTCPPEHHKRDCTNPEGLTHALLYRCKRADSLLQIAAEQSLGDPEDNEMPYLEVVYELVQFVNAMHKNCWILRDLCCTTLYRSQMQDKVFMPRVGRMLKIEKRNSRVEACIIDKLTCVDDRRNWMPAEVIQSGQFSQASDVYMMAMTIYQFYSTASLWKSNPNARSLEAVPFCKVEPEKLLETLYRGEVPEEPDSCPGWLFDIMKECWNRDLTKRPSTDYILEEINKRLIYTDDSTFESISSTETSASAGNVLPRDSRDQNATRILPDIPPAKETDRPIPPPRLKRAKNRQESNQENEYFNVNKFVNIDQNSVQGGSLTKMCSRVTGNNVAATSSSNPDDLRLTCANDNGGTYVNSVNESYTTSIPTVERKSTRTHVEPIVGPSNFSLHDKTIARCFEDDMPGYLDLDQSLNKEACSTTVAVTKPPEVLHDSSQEETILRTAFMDNIEGYQDFDPQDMIESDIISNSSERSLRDRPQQALPLVTGNHDVSRTASIVTNGSSNHSAISCANSETLESVSDNYSYATTISNPPNIISRDRSRQALPQVPDNHDVSRTASTVTNGGSNDSAISCANSETLESVSDNYSYATTISNPPNIISRDRFRQALPHVLGNHDVSRTASTVTNGGSNDSAISCANSEASEMVEDIYDYADVTPNSSRSNSRNKPPQNLPQVPGNHDVSRTASIVTNGSSNNSAISCANSEASELVENIYDYADVTPNSSRSNSRNKPPQNLPQVRGNHDVSRTASIVTNGSSNDSTISCANSEAIESEYESIYV